MRRGALFGVAAAALGAASCGLVLGVDYSAPGAGAPPEGGTAFEGAAVDARDDLSVDAGDELSADAPAPSGIVFVGDVGTSGASMNTLASLSVPAAATLPGDTIIVCLLLSTVNSGSVDVRDSVGNTYIQVAVAPDGNRNDRLVMFASFAASALSAGSTLDFTFPSCKSAVALAVEFAGVSSLGGSNVAGGSSLCSTFSTGTVQTSAAAELLVACSAGESGTPAWSGSGWSPIPAASVGDDALIAEYQVVPSGVYSATGQCGSSASGWMAALAAFR
jgi:hypothetical protein